MRERTIRPPGASKAAKTIMEERGEPALLRAADLGVRASATATLRLV